MELMTMPEQSAEIKTSNFISTLDVKYFTEGRFQVGHKTSGTIFIGSWKNTVVS